MFDEFIAASAARWNVPDSWVRAVIETESSWNPQAHNASDPTGAYGLMQILYRTATALGYTGAPDGLYDPETNIDLGTKLLGQLRRAYGDDFRRVYSAYNSGKPDLWQTSAQVATNVGRALVNLKKWVTSEFQEITGGNSGVVLLLAMVLLWAWGKRK